MLKQSRKWIFDTVVLSNFFLADAEALLQKRYKSKAIITSEIYAELIAGIQQHPSLKKIDSLLTDGSFELIALTREELSACQQLLTFLDLGEASAISYAQQHNYIVVTDDRAARNYCARVNIPVTGTIGILKACIQDKLIPLEDADSILNKMITVGFYSPVQSISSIS